MATSLAAPQTHSTPKRRFGADDVAYGVVVLFAFAIFAITLLLVVELWTNSAATRAKFGWAFLTSSMWNPVTNQYGAAPYLYGTVITSVIALVISVPLGVGAATYLSELALPKVSNALTFLVELLAAVPSVIYGLLAIFTLVPLMRDYLGPAIQKVFGSTALFGGHLYGVGYLTAGMILAIMTFPYIISVSREALMAVPREQREASLALGATKWESTKDAVLPFARLGIIGSIFLALARALGETMAVTMVIGNQPAIHASLFAPGYSIASVIANEFAEADDIHRSALIELGLVLFALTMIVNGAAQLLIKLTTKKGSAKA